MKKYKTFLRTAIAYYSLFEAATTITSFFMELFCFASSMLFNIVSKLPLRPISFI